MKTLHTSNRKRAVRDSDIVGEQTRERQRWNVGEQRRAREQQKLGMLRAGQVFLTHT